MKSMNVNMVSSRGIFLVEVHINHSLAFPPFPLLHPHNTTRIKMSGGGLSKCSKIRHIVRLRQLLRRWRNKARLAARIAAIPSHIPSDVPAGHVAVCVGASSRRFVVRATHLNHPVFMKLLMEAEEEYGFSGRPGPLCIPCDESVFEEILRFISRTDNNSHGSGRFATLDDFKRCAADRMADSRPLLHGLSEKSVW